MPRDPAYRRYRVALYCVYGVICGAFFVQLVRSVMGDVYGRRGAVGQQQSPSACLDDVERLYAQISARAVQAAPGGLGGDALSREWDAWSRRWEDDVERVGERCRIGGPAGKALADALDGVEELRRRLSRSGEDAAEDARRVKEALAVARREIKLR